MRLCGGNFQRTSWSLLERRVVRLADRLEPRVGVKFMVVFGRVDHLKIRTFLGPHEAEDRRRRLVLCDRVVRLEATAKDCLLKRRRGRSNCWILLFGSPLLHHLRRQCDRQGREGGRAASKFRSGRGDWICELLIKMLTHPRPRPRPRRRRACRAWPRSRPRTPQSRPRRCRGAPRTPSQRMPASSESTPRPRPGR